MRGVVAAGHPQTAAAAAEILEQGGNAVDAAVAATFASFIAEAVLVNIGGGGIAQVYDPDKGQSRVYDFFSAMPGLSLEGEPGTDALDFRRVLTDFGATVQPFYIGRGSVAVPGAVTGLCRMVDEMGRLPLHQILAPAVRLAREGVPVTQTQAYIASLIAPILTDTPGITKVFAPTGQVVRPGERLRLPELGDTLEKLARFGSDDFYAGALSSEIIADQRANGGLITRADLDAYRTFTVAPISVDYRGFTVQLPPSASTGGVLIGFSLRLLASLSIGTVAHGSFDHLRMLAEVMRITNIARVWWETHRLPPGSDGLDAVVQEFLGDGYINPYRKALQAALAGNQTAPEPEFPGGPHSTTHVSVVDGNGMVAGITTSAGENAGFVVGDTGVMLNNILGETDLHPTGFHKAPPGQRLATMMSPVIVMKSGRPAMVLGSGGSNRLRSAILQVISNTLDFGMPLPQAVQAPRIHFEEGVLQLEGGIEPPVADQLAAADYTVNRWPGRNLFFGGTHAVALEGGTTWVPCGDPRRGGAVAHAS